MKKIKSQVTMLMIVGLVIFITISLALYLYKSTVRKYSQQTIKNSQEASLDSQAVKEFVTRCISKLAKDAVLLLGKQGGYIYTSQGGTVIDLTDDLEGKYFVKYNGNKVVYNIKKQTESPLYSTEIPLYPWLFFPYEAEPPSEKLFENDVFGRGEMPPLNSGPFSIRLQLEAFVDNKTSGCADFSLFEKQGYEIEMSNSSTSVTIGSSDISINSIIPIKVTNTITKQTFEMSQFSTRLDLRLEEIYYFVKRLVDEDAINVTFNIKHPDNNRDSMEVGTIEIGSSRDDLIMIMDQKSLINGQPYQYIFARKNRAPALYYLPSVLSFPSGYAMTESDLLSGNSLKAEDPDEDELTFTIFVGESGEDLADFPFTIGGPQTKFRVSVSDGELSDYQIITVNS